MNINEPSGFNTMWPLYNNVLKDIDSGIQEFSIKTILKYGLTYSSSGGGKRMRSTVMGRVSLDVSTFWEAFVKTQNNGRAPLLFGGGVYINKGQS